MNTIKLTGKRCLCNACGEVFSTESNFNKHRRGQHGVDRHCLEPSLCGLQRNPAGIWKLPPREGFGSAS